MHETSKAVQRRLHDANFLSRYFRGNGIDIGAGTDPLGAYIELFPLMESCLSFDRVHGDAETMAGHKDDTFDFVHSSHCLEDMHDPNTALNNWFRIVKPGGHLIVTVPDEDMYEQGIFPSTFNADHKSTWTIFKYSSWSAESWNIVDLIKGLGDAADLIKIEQLTGTYRFGLDRQDQTRTPIGEAAIEFVIRKRGDTVKSNAVRAERPKIALHRPGAIGDILMTLSLVPLLKAKYPEHDIYYSCNPQIGEGLKSLMKKAGIKGGFNCGLIEEKRQEFDKVFNLIGYPLAEGYPEKPMKKHLIEYFADEMDLELALTEFPHLTLDPGRQVSVTPERYATIHPQAGWSAYKNWPHERWYKIVEERKDIKFFQIGAESDPKILGADCRFLGAPLDVSFNLMAYAALHVGIDSWTNHATNIEWKGRGFTPAIVLWGSTQWDAAGYSRNTNISLGLPCQPCFREDPKISRMPRGPCINPPDQDYDHPRHACMAGITVEMVLAEIERKWPCRTGSHSP